VSGLDRLLQFDGFPEKGSRVGLLCHHASVSQDGTHLIDHVCRRRDWTPKCIFSPEHGFTGDAAAGEPVPDGIHPSARIPVYSLYGETRSPREKWLEPLDWVVTDLKDLGVRCYTYASTLMEMMRACARAGVGVLVLDRSTPLAGIQDGPDLEDSCKSFVGQIPLPLVYGLSQGKLAAALQENVPELKHLRLRVLPDLPEAAHDWIPPSPAIVSPESACCYPITVWSEAIPGVWVDRGGEGSFQIWAMQDFPERAFEDKEMYGYRVTKQRVATPQGEWPGLHFCSLPGKKLRPVSLAHWILKTLVATLGPERLFQSEGSRPEFFDQLAGTTSWRTCLSQGADPDFLRRT